MLIAQDRKIEGDSTTWKNYQSDFSPTTCKPCEKRHGKIVLANDIIAVNSVLLHIKCMCKLVSMRTKQAGTATSKSKAGADYYLTYFKSLPNYYITKDQAKNQGWATWKGNLADVCPNKMIGGDPYENREKKLPVAINRTWHEADLDYSSGYRNTYRILYSNDGLVFVSYDHYQTFYEITK